MEGNFGSGKHWQMIKSSPNFSHPILILKNLCDNQCVHACGHCDVDFKHVATSTESDEHKDEGLPGPTELLSESVPLKVIELADDKVANVTPHNNRTRPYLMLMQPKDMKFTSRFQNMA